MLYFCVRFFFLQYKNACFFVALQMRRLERKRKPPARRSLIAKKKSKRNPFETGIAYSLLSLSDSLHLSQLDASHTKMPENPSLSDKFENEFSAAQILASFAESINLECEGDNVEQEQPTVNYTQSDT